MKPKITASIKRQFHSGKLSMKTAKLFDDYYKIITDTLEEKGILDDLDTDMIGDNFLDGKSTDEVIEFYESWHVENEQTVFLNSCFKALKQMGMQGFDKSEILRYFNAGLSVDQVINIFRD